MSDELRFPIGRFVRPEALSASERAPLLERVRTTPERLADVVVGLSKERLESPYREGGWTARQVVHHVPDSHMQAYARMKMALTEDEPTIKPYQEAAWAKLPDTFEVPVETSLTMLDCLHKRWLAIFDSMTEGQWKRTFRHPEIGPMSLEVLLALYAWHGDHHIGHVRILAG